LVDVVCKAMALLYGGMSLAEAKLMLWDPIMGSDVSA